MPARSSRASWPADSTSLFFIRCSSHLSSCSCGHHVGTPKVWEAVRTAANLPSVPFHDLRHTFASFGAAGGLSLPLIAAVLGHRDVKTTQQYAHLADSPVKAAADRTAAANRGAR